MFSIGKLVDGKPERSTFLTTNIFVYDERKQGLSIIQVLVRDRKIVYVDLGICGKGPETFKEVISAIHEQMTRGTDGTRFIYKEHIRDIADVDAFAVDHFWPYIERYEVMGTHEDIAERLRKCFPKS